MTIRDKTPFENVLYESNREVRLALRDLTEQYNVAAKTTAKYHDALHEITQLQDGVYELSDARALAHEGLA